MSRIDDLITGRIINKYCPIQTKSDQFMVAHGYRKPHIEHHNFKKTLFERVELSKRKKIFKKYE